MALVPVVPQGWGPEASWGAAMTVRQAPHQRGTLQRVIQEQNGGDTKRKGLLVLPCRGRLNYGQGLPTPTERGVRQLTRPLTKPVAAVSAASRRPDSAVDIHVGEEKKKTEENRR